MISTMYTQQQMAPMPQQQKPSIQKVDLTIYSNNLSLLSLCSY